MTESNINSKIKKQFSNTADNLPSINVPYVLSIDWLSYSCKSILPPKLPVIIKVLKFSTSIFNTCEQYLINDKPIATIFRTPKTPIIPADSAILKFENYLLYTDDFYLQLQYYFDLFNITNYKINRIDICADFQQFRRRILPQQLIKWFFNDRIIKSGKSKFTAIGTSEAGISYEYLRFGNRSSFVSSYMYNKSLEFKEKKEKSYITDLWAKVGFDLEKDVWRLEFSITGFNQFMFSKDTGEMFKILDNSLNDEVYMVNLFMVLVSKYFKFIYTGKQQHNKDRKELQLFDFKYMRNIKLQKFNYTKDSSKFNKIIINQMVENFKSYKKEDEIQATQFEAFMYSYCQNFNLLDYLIHKLQY